MIDTPFNKIKIRKSYQQNSIREIYEIIKNTQGKTPEFQREKFIDDIIGFLRNFIESKLSGGTNTSKISIYNSMLFELNPSNLKIFEDIAFGIKAKEIN